MICQVFLSLIQIPIQHQLVNDGRTGRFQRFIVAMDIKDDTRKRNFLLYLAGPEVDKIFETLPETGEEKDFALEPIYIYYKFKLMGKALQKTSN